jgi:hypothetical protein
LAHKTGILIFDGRLFAQRFQGLSKSRAYDLANELVDIGFLRLIKKSKRCKNGLFSAKEYQVLSHEEWAKENPGACKRLLDERIADHDSPVQPGGMDHSPVQPADSPVQRADSPVQPADSPVQPGGHNSSYLPNTNLPPIDNRSPVQPGGMDKFQKRWSKKSGVSVSEANANEAYTRQSSFSEATFDGRPVQPGGTVVNDTKGVGMDWYGKPLPGCDCDDAGYYSLATGKRVSFEEAKRLAEGVYDIAKTN